MLRALPPVGLAEVFLSLFFLLALLAAAGVVPAMIDYLMFGCVAVVDCTYNLYCRLLIRVIRLIFDDGHEKSSECRGVAIPGYATSVVIS